MRPAPSAQPQVRRTTRLTTALEIDSERARLKITNHTRNRSGKVLDHTEAWARQCLQCLCLRHIYCLQEAIMFEVPVDKQESKLKYERIGISILVLLVIAGAAFYFIPKQGAKQPAAAADVPAAPAAPIHACAIIHLRLN